MTKAAVIALFMYLSALALAHAQQSVCYGTTAKGRVEHAVKLPSEGDNFVSYGALPEINGRTYVHNRVARVVVDAYAALLQSHPYKVFKYAETGFEHGGEFSPHKTHQNGLSIDFMVPVLNANGVSVHLPTTVFNRYGYDIEFDNKGKTKEYTIDFDALGAHLVALHEAAQQHGIDIWRVLFAPDLQAKLYATRHGDYIKKHIQIPTKPSWVRHDEHYHVDFKLDCKPL